MDEGLSLRHSRWECKYHVVFIPKCATSWPKLPNHRGYQMGRFLLWLSRNCFFLG